MTITIRHPRTRPAASAHAILALIAVAIVAIALFVAFRVIGSSSDPNESPAPAVYVATDADLFEQRAAADTPATYLARSADLFEQRLTTSDEPGPR